MAAKLREVFALESAGPTYEGREQVQQIQGQLTRLACAANLQSSAFDAATIQALRRAYARRRAWMVAASNALLCRLAAQARRVSWPWICCTCSRPS